jgi:hypothetical protein
MQNIPKYPKISKEGYKERIKSVRRKGYTCGKNLALNQLVNTPILGAFCDLQGKESLRKKVF